MTNETDYGLDGFCVRNHFLENAGFPVGAEVQTRLPENSPAFENLHGHFGTVVGSHFTGDVIAVRLDNHPSQKAAYFLPCDLVPVSRANGMT